MQVPPIPTAPAAFQRAAQPQQPANLAPGYRSHPGSPLIAHSPYSNQMHHQTQRTVTQAYHVPPYTSWSATSQGYDPTLAASTQSHDLTFPTYGYPPPLASNPYANFAGQSPVLPNTFAASTLSVSPPNTHQCPAMRNNAIPGASAVGFAHSPGPATAFEFHQFQMFQYTHTLYAGPYP